MEQQRRNGSIFLVHSIVFSVHLPAGSAGVPRGASAIALPGPWPFETKTRTDHPNLPGPHLLQLCQNSVYHAIARHDVLGRTLQCYTQTRRDSPAAKGRDKDDNELKVVDATQPSQTRLCGFRNSSDHAPSSHHQNPIQNQTHSPHQRYHPQPTHHHQQSFE